MFVLDGLPSHGTGVPSVTAQNLVEEGWEEPEETTRRSAQARGWSRCLLLCIETTGHTVSLLPTETGEAVQNSSSSSTGWRGIHPRFLYLTKWWLCSCSAAATHDSRFLWAKPISKTSNFPANGKTYSNCSCTINKCTIQSSTAKIVSYRLYS